ncbi:acyl-CoA N-acyltransferase [Polyplosphaeria fusca]|uniref:Acyl-CoA N-acyltransferase n=1 Tax=Polyplosphaeria fusca TaxID=682080 RepID=A0A9P4UZD6_9PLEO|nr:acyl-CoA N-acyltransferase [Polyplosphaeria fusca]
MPPQKDPFRTPRLFFRAIQTPTDNPLFDAINADRIGYMNSNASNIKLPGDKDARKWQKQVAEESLLGCVICLHPDAARAGGAEREAESEARAKTDQPQGTPIGQLTLKPLPPALMHHRNTELAIDILPQFQGKGYGSEAIAWVLDYAFRRAGLHRVSIRAFGWNEGAARLYERLGFVLEGRMREALWHEGRWWDGIEMGMLEGEWWARERERRAKEE